jgi:nucleotide-binding universal stress UspA family protein
MPARIFVGIDGSTYADKAFECATSLAQKFEHFIVHYYHPYV